MQPPDSAARKVEHFISASPPDPSAKRKSLGLDVAPNSKPSRQPATKRLRTSYYPGDLGQEPLAMNKGKSVITRPGVVDLTGGHSNFQPQNGVKRLVIKNLKTSISSKGVEDYYNNAWDELDEDLTSIFHGKALKKPKDTLYRGVESICRRGQAQRLSKHVGSRILGYLRKELLPAIETEIRTKNNVEVLRIINEQWKTWVKKSTLIRSLYAFLDNTYHAHTKDCVLLQDQGITQFRYLLTNHWKTSEAQIISRVVEGLCELISYDRANDNRNFDGVLLREAISLLHITKTYPQFEAEFLKLSDEYYTSLSSGRDQGSMAPYIRQCETLIEKESARCDAYNFNSKTKRSLLDLAYRNLIERCSTFLLDTDDIGRLIDQNDMVSLKTLYYLLGLSRIHVDLMTPWEAYMMKVGSSIVSDKERINDIVIRLLELKRKLDLIIRDAFQKDDSFRLKLRESFSQFMNDRDNAAKLGKQAGNSKVGEMVAKYMDLLLRNGIKAVPRSLASDAQDRAAAEKLGKSSTGDEDAELDWHLEQGLELFRFIEGKDVFEAFYKKDLAKRLLMGRSANQDAERNMLAKMKAECGNAFTQNLEQMFKDQEMAKEVMAKYKLKNEKSGLDLQVSVLSSAAWPTYPDVTVHLPSDVARHIERYDAYYKHKYTGRKLDWKHSLAHSVVTATFDKGKKELFVSAFQAIVLVLFNDIAPQGNISYKDIAEATGLVDAELTRTLQSLACAKVKVLTKNPKGRDVNPTDTFTVNTSFWDPKFRIKINQIQLKETAEEVEATHERVYQDRQYETQAAIVRIMKARKKMTHSNLIAEVIAQTKKRGMVEVGEIKKNIEKLIEKEYIEREDGLYNYLA